MLRGLASSLVLALGLVVAVGARESSVNVSVDSDKGVRSCGDIRIEFDGRPAERAEDTFRLPGGAPLRVRLPAHSGIRVTGASRSDFAVTVCKAAARAESLNVIRVSPQGSGLDFSGSGGEDWIAYLLVEAPKNAGLDLEAKNGSINVDGTSGQVDARTTNGPIELSNCSGQIQADAQNGPISLEGCTGMGEARAVNGPVHISGNSGKYRLSTQNGPISVELLGDRWNGTLDARAVNGPLSLKISDRYRSGVLVEATGQGPFSCPDSACRAARRTFDDAGRRIEFGESEPVVRLSTRNGPVSIEPAD